MRLVTKISLFLFLAACSKKQAQDIKFGDPVGIELAGEGLMGAVAPEAGHELPNAAVPELATALAAASKACPDLKSHITAGRFISLRANVADGTLHAPTDEKMDADTACVAKALEGKPVKNLSSMVLVVQLASKESVK